MGFFEDLSKKASETCKNTAEKTNKITRELKLKSLINEDKSKIEKIYAEIGKKVYEKHIREENIDIKNELIDECSKIDAYAKEIEDMNMEMLSLKDLRICKKCASEISISAKFCPKCGALQEEAKEDNVTSDVQEESNVSGVQEESNVSVIQNENSALVVQNENNIQGENNIQENNNLSENNE